MLFQKDFFTKDRIIGTLKMKYSMSKRGEDDRNNEKVTTPPVDSLDNEMLKIQPKDSETFNYKENESKLYPVPREWVKRVVLFIIFLNIPSVKKKSDCW